nr:immunoglobulin light chain junction region [Macaca mulatta]MOW39380.1 immunoglobulin light chain junction region [Macaca mulatta]MOW39873.1 immunoglobulin light chain junction region [Macaca mulatta]
CLQSSKWPLTF